MATANGSPLSVTSSLPNFVSEQEEYRVILHKHIEGCTFHFYCNKQGRPAFRKYDRINDNTNNESQQQVFRNKGDEFLVVNGTSLRDLSYPQAKNILKKCFRQSNVAHFWMRDSRYVNQQQEEQPVVTQPDNLPLQPQTDCNNSNKIDNVNDNKNNGTENQMRSQKLDKLEAQLRRITLDTRRYIGKQPRQEQDEEKKEEELIQQQQQQPPDKFDISSLTELSFLPSTIQSIVDENNTLLDIDGDQDEKENNMVSLDDTLDWTHNLSAFLSEGDRDFMEALETMSAVLSEKSRLEGGSFSEKKETGVDQGNISTEKLSTLQQAVRRLQQRLKLQESDLKHQQTILAELSRKLEDAQQNQPLTDMEESTIVRNLVILAAIGGCLIQNTLDCTK